jgi:hypothetical protein
MVLIVQYTVTGSLLPEKVAEPDRGVDVEFKIELMLYI